MGDFYSVTNTQLLDALCSDDDAQAWAEVEARLKPVAFAVARRVLGNDADALDAMQDALLTMLQECGAGHYDRTRGRFHVWARCIVHRRAVDLWRRRARELRGDESGLEQLPGADELGELWQRECDDVVLRRSMERLRASERFEPATLAAFDRLTLEKKSVAEVAVEFHLTEDGVYALRHRCYKYLRSIEPEIRRAFELD